MKFKTDTLTETDFGLILPITNCEFRLFTGAWN